MHAHTHSDRTCILVDQQPTRSVRRPRWSVVALLLLVLTLPALTLLSGTRAVAASDPAAVVDRYVAAVNAGDLEGVLALYADDAVHIALPADEGSGVCLGKEQFRQFYAQSLANSEHLEVVAGPLVVAGEQVTFVTRIASEPWRALGITTLEANNEAVIVDGRITTHVVMLTPESVRELLIARGTIPTEAAGEQGQETPRRWPQRAI